MKRFIKLLMIIFIFPLAFTLFSKNFNKKEFLKEFPKINGNGGAREFYFSVIPSYEVEDTNNVVSLFISSYVRTKVSVTVEGKGYERIKYTKPDNFIEFILPSDIAQVYSKSKGEKSKSGQIWKDCAIHVIADDPIICYALTHNNLSDGFLVLPKNQLAKQYIVSSFETKDDEFNNTIAPSYTSIVAIYDKTEVEFILGGNDWTQTDSGLKSGDTSKWNMDKGDVLLIGSSSSHSDLSGSIINASKPVAVVSGNYYTSVPSGSQQSGFIQNMEMPTMVWGKEYLVPAIYNRKKNSIIKIFAKERNTTIYRDYHQIGFIKNAGGTIGNAYLQIRAGDNSPRPVVISGDKKINVIQYNTSKDDDSTIGSPFEMGLIPVYNFTRETIFNTAGFDNGKSFDNYYLHLCYEATQLGTIPEDLELATLENGKFSWQKMIDLSPNPGTAFTKLTNGGNYYSKILKLPEGVYKLKSSKLFAAYIYGVSDNDAYGYSTSYPDNSLIIDTMPPKPQWTMSCNGNVTNGYVEDKPIGSENNSKLSAVFMNTDLSYNYKFYINDFIPCEDWATNWQLNIMDDCSDAMAVLTFVDCAGNDTTVYIKYTAMKMTIEPQNYDFGKVNSGNSIDKLFYIVNNSSGDRAELDDIRLADNSQNYSFWNEDGKSRLQFPKIIEPLDSLAFIVRFTATSEGEFKNSIGLLKDSCNLCFKSNVNARVGRALIYVSDCIFPPTQANKISWNYFDVKNIGSINLKLYGYKGPFIMGVNKDGNTYKVFSSKSLDDANIDSAFGETIVLESGMTKTFQIKFEPDKEKNYLDSILFISNSVKLDKDGISADNVCLLSGMGIPTSVKDNYLSKFIRISPNPVKNSLLFEVIDNNLLMKSIDISNINGHTIYSKQLNNNLSSIDLSKYPNGAYFLNVITNQGLFKQKFIIKH